MEQRRNLCAQIPLSLHAKVAEARERSGLTTAEYITNLLTEYYEMKENGVPSCVIGYGSRLCFLAACSISWVTRTY